MNQPAAIHHHAAESDSLSQTVDVETPELVVLSYAIAGVGSRAYAAVIDYVIAFTLLLLVGGGLAVLTSRGGPRVAPSQSQAWALAVFVLAQFIVLWGYYVLFEALWDGQTPGKRMQRLRVVRDGGYSVNFAASAVRNLVRFVDMQPVLTYGIGIVAVVSSKTGKRLGDIVAGTLVVREEVIRQPGAVTGPAVQPGEPSAALPIQSALTDDEFAVLARFVERRSTLDATRRTSLAAQLAARLSAALPAEGSSDVARLLRLFESEQLAHSRGVAGRATTGAARERHAIVATGSPRWNSFAARLATAQSRGLKSLGENGVREFVADYRQLSADLARLRTATRDRSEPELFHLSRLVAGAHNLLYRGRTVTPWDALRFLAVDAPREVRRSARPILLAALLLFGPAAIAYTAVVTNPPVARMFIPDAMIDRAEQGVRRAQTGEGYIPDPQLFRPVMASSIVSNNVQVTFAAFAAGITAGIGTLLLLASNGIFLGGIFGLYASKGIGTLLLAFVAPHGVLELSAICIAGGAGFLLAAALLLPGALTRRAALVQNGRRAIRLVAVSTLLLVFAGTLEGFVSPIPYWPLEWKLSVSVLTAMALYFYIRAPRVKYTPVPTDATDEPTELLALGEQADST